MSGERGSDVLSAPYWDGARRGVLVVQRCDGCGALRHYPRVLCDLCHSFDWSPVELQGTGTVHSWTVAHHAFAPDVADEVPYVLVTVDMTDRVRVLGRLTGVEPSVGLPVRLDFAHDPPQPVFGPAGSTDDAGQANQAEAAGQPA